MLQVYFVPTSISVVLNQDQLNQTYLIQSSDFQQGQAQFCKGMFNLWCKL